MIWSFFRIQPAKLFLFVTRPVSGFNFEAAVRYELSRVRFDSGRYELSRVRFVLSTSCHESNFGTLLLSHWADKIGHRISHKNWVQTPESTQPSQTSSLILKLDFTLPQPPKYHATRRPRAAFCGSSSKSSNTDQSRIMRPMTVLA